MGCRQSGCAAACPAPLPPDVRITSMCIDVHRLDGCMCPVPQGAAKLENQVAGAFPPSRNFSSGNLDGGRSESEPLIGPGKLEVSATSHARWQTKTQWSLLPPPPQPRPSSCCDRMASQRAFGPHSPLCNGRCPSDPRFQQRLPKRDRGDRLMRWAAFCELRVVIRDCRLLRGLLAYQKGGAGRPTDGPRRRLRRFRNIWWHCR